MFPLWALNDEAHGGLSFSARDIGMAMLLAAPGQILTQVSALAAVEYRVTPGLTCDRPGLMFHLVVFVSPFRSFSSLTCPTGLDTSACFSRLSVKRMGYTLKHYFYHPNAAHGVSIWKPTVLVLLDQIDRICSLRLFLGYGYY